MVKRAAKSSLFFAYIFCITPLTVSGKLDLSRQGIDLASLGRLSPRVNMKCRLFCGGNDLANSSVNCLSNALVGVSKELARVA